MCNNTNNSHQPAAYRSRIEYEDQVLAARTHIFLVVNGLAVVAVGLATAVAAKFIITTVAVLISFLWTICAYQSFRSIKELTIQHRHLAPDDPIETLHKKTLGSWYWIRPTNILSIYVPCLVFIGWLAGLSILLVLMGRSAS